MHHSGTGLSASTISTYWLDIAQHLARGLADNWSQVHVHVHVHATLYIRMYMYIHVKCTYCMQLQFWINTCF